KPNYSGSPGFIHKKVGEKMMEILTAKTEFHYINEEALIVLNDERRKYWYNNISSTQRVVWLNREEMIFETFTGTVIANTLVWMLRYFKVDAKVIDDIGRIKISFTSNLKSTFEKMKNKKWEVSDILSSIRGDEWLETKYSKEIPKELNEKIH